MSDTATPAAATQARELISDKTVLLVISGGLIIILLSIIVGLFLSSRPGLVLPNWAENVFVSIATAAALKLGDCLATLVALSSGRQVERLGAQLGNSQPSDAKPAPQSAAAGADEAAEAAARRAAEIARQVDAPREEPQS